MGQEEIHTPKPPKSLWPVFFWSLLGLALFLIANKALLSFSGPLQPEDAERAAQRRKVYEELMAENETKLSSYSWVDKDKGGVQIPIQLAITLAKEKLSRQSPVVWQAPAENLPAQTKNPAINNPAPSVRPIQEPPANELPVNELIPNMDSGNGDAKAAPSVAPDNPQPQVAIPENQGPLPIPEGTETGTNPSTQSPLQSR